MKYQARKRCPSFQAMSNLHKKPRKCCQQLEYNGKGNSAEVQISCVRRLMTSHFKTETCEFRV